MRKKERENLTNMTKTMEIISLKPVEILIKNIYFGVLYINYNI